VCVCVCVRERERECLCGCVNDHACRCVFVHVYVCLHECTCMHVPLGACVWHIDAHCYLDALVFDNVVLIFTITLSLPYTSTYDQIRARERTSIHVTIVQICVFA